MEKLKLALLGVVTLLLVGFLGYWSVSTLESGTEYARRDRIRELQKENENLKSQVSDLASTVSALQPKQEEPSPVAQSPAPNVNKYQSLIDELGKLVTDKVSMKKGSAGPRVGTI